MKIRSKVPFASFDAVTELVQEPDFDLLVNPIIFGQQGPQRAERGLCLAG